MKRILYFATLGQHVGHWRAMLSVGLEAIEARMRTGRPLASRVDSSGRSRHRPLATTESLINIVSQELMTRKDGSCINWSVSTSSYSGCCVRTFRTEVNSRGAVAELVRVVVLVHMHRILMSHLIIATGLLSVARMAPKMSHKLAPYLSKLDRHLRRQGGRCMILVAAVACMGPANPAWACSDLPNICEMNQLAWEQNMELARQAGQSDADERDYADQRDADHNRGGSSGPPPRDPMDIKMDLAAGNIFAMHAMATDEIEKMKRDPEMGPIIRGKWDFFQDANNAAPGEYCAALYMNMAGLVRLSGPGGSNRGALLTFWGPNIPQPDKVRWVSVTLRQVVNNDPNNSSTQTVRAYNYTETRIKGVGAIALAVPSADALLNNISDNLDFKLEVDGKEVQAIGMHSGLSARDNLRQCIARRPS